MFCCQWEIIERKPKTRAKTKTAKVKINVKAKKKNANNNESQKYLAKNLIYCCFIKTDQKQ